MRLYVMEVVPYLVACWKVCSHILLSETDGLGTDGFEGHGHPHDGNLLGRVRNFQLLGGKSSKSC